MTEFRPSRFEILPPVVKNLVIINALVFLAQITIPDTVFSFNNIFALHTWQSTLFKPWQIITHGFMHADFSHILFNMLGIWMIGSILENLWGKTRFLVFYFACLMGAAFCHLVFQYYEAEKLITLFKSISPEEQQMVQQNFNAALNNVSVGASGAAFGCMAAFGYLFPNTYVYFYFLVPIKAKWFVLGYIAIELYLGIQNSQGDSVAHFAHLGGAIVGFILVLFWNKTNRKSFF